MGKQKVVIRVSMKDAKKRTKALKIAVGLPGIISAKIEGVDKDRLVVIGDGIDSVKLTMMLRKQMGSAELLVVSSFDDEKEKYFRNGGKMVEMWPSTPANTYSTQDPYTYNATPYPYNATPYPYTYSTQDPNPSCTIM